MGGEVERRRGALLKWRYAINFGTQNLALIPFVLVEIQGSSTFMQIKKYKKFIRSSTITYRLYSIIHD